VRHARTSAVALAAVAAVAAGCGSSNSSSSSSGSSGTGSSASATSTAAGASVGSSSSNRYGYGGAGASRSPNGSSGSTAKVTVRQLSVGKALVGPSGRTLYLFEKDRGPKSACLGACARGWPPLMTIGAAKAGTGLKASLLSEIKRPGGKQVAYAGHPLYYFVGDQKAGQDNGEGKNAFGAEWYVVAPSGKKLEEEGS
jgi:predicted lipoprotein with Yx(FWY)xxD motif